MRIIKKFNIVGSFIAAIVFMITPLIYWIGNPEQTSMQIFIRFWWAYIGFIVFATVFYILFSQDRERM